MSVDRYAVGDIRLTRFGYTDIGIDPERAGVSVEQIARVPWAEPLWAKGAELLAGAAVWVIESADAVIVVDPAQAADEIIRNDADAGFFQAEFAQLLEANGIAREAVTTTIATHIEGIGMFAWRNGDGSWTRFFPNAPLLVTRPELAAFERGALARSEHAAFRALYDDGVVAAVDEHTEIAPGVSMEVIGGHSPGHGVVHIRSDGAAAVMVGHLALSPVHLVTGECPQQHPDPARVEHALARLRAGETLLVGPLWPAPGAGRWIDGEFVPESAGRATAAG